MITTKKYATFDALNNRYQKQIINRLKWNTSNNFCSSKTIIPSFYTSQACTDQPLCFKSFIMTSYQSIVNINIIMKFLIGHKAFVSLCTTLPYISQHEKSLLRLGPETHIFCDLYNRSQTFNLTSIHDTCLGGAQETSIHDNASLWPSPVVLHDCAHTVFVSSMLTLSVTEANS